MVELIDLISLFLGCLLLLALSRTRTSLEFTFNCMHLYSTTSRPVDPREWTVLEL